MFAFLKVGLGSKSGELREDRSSSASMPPVEEAVDVTWELEVVLGSAATTVLPLARDFFFLDLVLEVVESRDVRSLEVFESEVALTRAIGAGDVAVFEFEFKFESESCLGDVLL